jgi:hypothetical protein
MSCTETETVANSTNINGIDRAIRQRKTARIDESFQSLPTNEGRPRRICRRHSFAFRCGEYGTDESRVEGEHYENVLLVKVSFDIPSSSSD